ncbi:MAG TPA: heparan-alpha-glucosaminide N-acetyltransferase domain-containing protein [Cyclobacteriaceae bacterium]|nr:heparan-alpha-glucosaminide N-acetyltransferase domain-containing protein [Cyclobacteriaceae bacterium]
MLKVNQAARIHSIDILRGTIMILMALDHVREYWSQTLYRPEDLTQTDELLFFTRWITYFCAPLFVFLSGISICLHQQKSHDKPALSRYLLKRGVWMLVLEVTVISFLLQFSYNLIILQVIWVIGWGMIVLAGLIWLPGRAVAFVVFIIIAGHNLLSNIQPVTSENFYLAMLHNSPFVLFPPGTPPILFSYAPIPWIAVLALGYLAGSWYKLPAEQASKALRLAGLFAIGMFILFRFINGYGDPIPWSVQDRGLTFTIMSFLSVAKYPPSLMFLLLTLGTGMVMLSLFNEAPGHLGRIISTFGRVPMFYYLLHLPLVVGGAVIWVFIQFHELTIIAFASANTQFPVGYMPSLLRTYLVWILVVIALYFPCRWYDNFKRAHSYKWLTYL